MGSKEYNATVRYVVDDLFVGTPPSGNAYLMDANSKRRSAPTPVEHLLVAVAGCTAFDVQSILQKKRQDVTAYWVEITGERRDEHPQAFVKFHVRHIVEGQGILRKR